jgi:V8-like Glu-specific endopeptidase
MCPSCHRRVPVRLRECRCGFDAGAALAETVDDDVIAGEAERSPSRRGLILVAVLVVLCAGTLAWPALQSSPESSGVDLATDDPPAGTDDARTDEKAMEDVAGTEETEGRHASPRDEAPRLVPLTTELPVSVRETTGTARAPASAEGATTRSLEDVVSRASGAVVAIETPSARGTGFFVTPDLLVTNAHVTDGHGFVTVRLISGETAQGRVERSSSQVDLAVVRVSVRPEAMQILQLGAAGPVRAGQEVIAIGSPMGLQNTVTRGIVSALRTSSGIELIQTDAAINPGNSGGPLLNRDGRVIGINTLKMTRGAESLGFAVAIAHAVPLIENRPVTSAITASSPASVAATLVPVPSATDAARIDGERVFEGAMRALAQRADQVDTQWVRFQSNCLVNAVPSDGQRPWFVVRDTLPTFKTGDRYCIAVLDDLRDYIAQWAHAMSQAQDTARRAGVFPGTMRDMRRRHRLDWTGWDR